LLAEMSVGGSCSLSKRLLCRMIHFPFRHCAAGEVVVLECTRTIYREVLPSSLQGKRAPAFEGRGHLVVCTSSRVELQLPELPALKPLPALAELQQAPKLPPAGHPPLLQPHRTKSAKSVQTTPVQ
jgi:hypothetical protein